MTNLKPTALKLYIFLKIINKVVSVFLINTKLKLNIFCFGLTYF